MIDEKRIEISPSQPKEMEPQGRTEAVAKIWQIETHWAIRHEVVNWVGNRYPKLTDFIYYISGSQKALQDEKDYNKTITPLKRLTAQLETERLIEVSQDPVLFDPPHFDEEEFYRQGAKSYYKDTPKNRVARLEYEKKFGRNFRDSPSFQFFCDLYYAQQILGWLSDEDLMEKGSAFIDKVDVKLQEVLLRLYHSPLLHNPMLRNFYSYIKRETGLGLPQLSLPGDFYSIIELTPLQQESLEEFAKKLRHK